MASRTYSVRVLGTAYFRRSTCTSRFTLTLSLALRLLLDHDRGR